MRINIVDKNGTISEVVRQHAEKKLRKLERYFRNLQSVEIEQTTERGQHVIELNVEGDGVFLRSEERCNDLYAAVDNAVDKLERQVKRFKTRIRRVHQRPGPVKEAVAELTTGLEGEETEEEDTPYAPLITRRKRFPMKPMSGEEAARQMELLGHDFFLFQNEETGQYNVLYRRRDGDYGLIEPET